MAPNVRCRTRAGSCGSTSAAMDAGDARFYRCSTEVVSPREERVLVDATRSVARRDPCARICAEAWQQASVSGGILQRRSATRKPRLARPLVVDRLRAEMPGASSNAHSGGNSPMNTTRSFGNMRSLMIAHPRKVADSVAAKTLRGPFDPFDPFARFDPSRYDTRSATMTSRDTYSCPVASRAPPQVMRVIHCLPSGRSGGLMTSPIGMVSRLKRSCLTILYL